MQRKMSSGLRRCPFPVLRVLRRFNRGILGEATNFFSSKLKATKWMSALLGFYLKNRPFGGDSAAILNFIILNCYSKNSCYGMLEGANTCCSTLHYLETSSI